ncbi:DNA cytosine methyltransferase [Hydrogenovibrio thermophilus]|uniref:Cytosine-specific methyltransferase n=1 Tax=Hydrogenovibrio thermophilus TaxID=265883 RepID=A0A410H2P6_9GAMM|nr:DNA cytosine methyltransferase [Hydrogenovibrio thermophilus]QAB15191.1 DNA cytosine methyltransferase [Hydrogenovibrio thermophilus]
MKDYLEIKTLLVEGLLEEFPQAEGDEAEAVVSHWLQASQNKIPFLTDSIRNYFEKEISNFLPSTHKNMVNESEGFYQFKLPINWKSIPYPPPKNPLFNFIDLFAGIGGFRLAMQNQNGKCVFSCEWDSYAKKTYETNFGEIPFGDIRKIDELEIPDHDVLCAGFPCQPFSLAGVSARNSRNTAHGFACETQGTLFFDIARIVEAKKPKVLFLENVRNIVNHDKGKTFSIIKSTIESLGYNFSYKVVDASPLVPQKRVRTYMVCTPKNMPEFSFPEIQGEPLPLKSILEDVVDESFTISDRLWEGHQRRTRNNLSRGTGFTAFCADIEKPSNTIVARYGKDGKECLIPQKESNPRMLTPRECARLQGFPEPFIIPVAKTAAYRQFGNSVAVPVVTEIAKAIVAYLDICKGK